eukprot:1494936-Alexandrium_andersonii.AAC.1
MHVAPTGPPTASLTRQPSGSGNGPSGGLSIASCSGGPLERIPMMPPRDVGRSPRLVAPPGI